MDKRKFKEEFLPEMLKILRMDDHSETLIKSLFEEIFEEIFETKTADLEERIRFAVRNPRN